MTIADPHPKPEAPESEQDVKADQTSSTEKDLESTVEKDKSEEKYPPQGTVLLIMTAMFMAAFLVALDRLIIATAIPAITNQFNSLADVGWYASAYLLTMCCFQLIFGRIYTFYNPKWVYLSMITLFELGSLICGVSPNSTTLIVGRAIAGMGSCGISNGAIILIVYAVPLHKRPMYTGFFGAVFGVASVVGPLLGGVFTDNISWRWCFYINLPIGGVVMVVIFFFLNLDFEPRQKLSWKQQVMQLDPIGSAVFLPSIVCLLLVLQNGGIKWAWGSARVIALLVVFGITIIAFIAIQVWRQETATVPPRIVKQRSILAGLFYLTFSGAGMMIFVYYIPIYFQAIKGSSAMKSGIQTIPMVLGLVVSSIMAGVLTRKVGYYTPWMYVSAILAPIGAGLITTFNTQTNHSKWIGYQVLYGLGLGFGVQQPSVAAQTICSKKDVPTAISLMFFAQTLGGTMFVSVANNIFDNTLAESLSKVPGLNGELISSVGATDLRKYVPDGMLGKVLTDYSDALRTTFIVGVATVSVAIFGAAFMEWRSIKPDAGPGGRPKSSESAKSDEGLKEPV